MKFPLVIAFLLLATNSDAQVRRIGDPPPYRGYTEMVQEIPSVYSVCVSNVTFIFLTTTNYYKGDASVRTTCTLTFEAYCDVRSLRSTQPIFDIKYVLSDAKSYGRSYGFGGGYCSVAYSSDLSTSKQIPKLDMPKKVEIRVDLWGVPMTDQTKLNFLEIRDNKKVLYSFGSLSKKSP